VDLDRDHRLLEIIRTQTEIAALGLDLLTTMQLIAERSQELTRASGAAIEVAEGEELVYHVTSGEATPYLGMRRPRTAGLPGLCLAEGRLLSAADTSTDPRVDAEACRRLGAAALVCVPLIHRRETVAVLEVYSAIAGSFDEEDVEALELLGEVIAAHISHAGRLELEGRDSRHDALTGLANRRAYEERLAVEAARATRYGTPLSLCLLDLDGFAQVNERLGHGAGDEVLRGVARAIEESRVADDAFRIGGDVFAVLMPQTRAAEARRAAARLVAAIAATGLGESGVGTSYGVAAASEDPELFHAAAEAELRAAKRRGRGGDGG
jgi:diguanylate cyclase